MSRGKREVLKETFTNGDGTLHNEVLYNLYSTPKIVEMIKSRGIRWTGMWSVRGKKKESMQVPGGKARRKETTRKVET
jgi:hypothetical protein